MAAMMDVMRLVDMRLPSVLPALLLDARDLRALDAEAAHEPLLIEHDRVDVARERVARERPRRALVDQHDARADADLESPRGVELLQRRFVHEEERVSERLRAGLEAVRGGDRVVV